MNPGSGQKRGECGQIPIRTVNIDMAEIGREDRQSTVNILTIAIQAKESGNGESVPEIM